MFASLPLYNSWALPMQRLYIKRSHDLRSNFDTIFCFLNIFRVSFSSLFFRLSLSSSNQIIVVQFYTITLRWLDYKIIIFISFFFFFILLNIFVTVSGSIHYDAAFVPFPFRHVKNISLLNFRSVNACVNK